MGLNSGNGWFLRETLKLPNLEFVVKDLY